MYFSILCTATDQVLAKIVRFGSFFVFYDDHMMELLLVFLVKGQKNGGRVFDSATMHDKTVAW